MEKKPERMWSRQWKYAESFVVVVGVVVAGWLLQLTVGGINYIYLRWPVNIIIGVIIILVITGLAFRHNSAVFRWFSGVHLSVTLIAALVVLGIVMGLTPQAVAAGSPHHGLSISQLLGFHSMTASWPFVLVYVFLLVALGSVIARRLLRFRFRDYAFYLNHAGLWILLFAAGIGAADARRYVMHVREGEVEWRVYSDTGDILDLPIAVELNDFDMEEYPPKLAVIDRSDGAVQPEGNPQFYQIDQKCPVETIGDWTITLERYLEHAVRNSDSTYNEVRMPGSAPAARISVANNRTGTRMSGWVCAGNIAQLYMALNLDANFAVVMTQPEPKRFMSDINVYSESGRTKKAVLEVNKPVKMGHWTLYQYGYDTDAGRMSTYSSIELVYDPWIMPVYAGIIMIMAGSVCMVWTGSRRKEDSDDVE